MVLVERPARVAREPVRVRSSGAAVDSRHGTAASMALMNRGPIRGTHVGRLPEPPDPERTSIVRCWRCGVVFDHHKQNVVADAPCLDCRRFLRAEGDKTKWRARGDKPRTERAAA